MREVELKAVVHDLAASRERLIQRGAQQCERGTLRDRRFDTADRALRARDIVLRVREFAGTPRSYASVDWKGPARVASGYKEREELTLGVSDGHAAERILRRLGYDVSFEIEREVDVYEYRGATVRFEQYARMDTLVEVEGAPDAIELAIAALGIARSEFGTGRLADFAKAFEARTGERAVVSRAEVAAVSPYARDDA